MEKELTIQTEVGEFTISCRDKNPIVQVHYFGYGSAIAVDKESLILMLEEALKELKK